MFNNSFIKYYTLGDVELNLGSGGAKIAVDVIGGDAFEVVKQAFGVEGVATLVSASNPLPVSATIDTTGLATSANQGIEILALNSIAAEDFATETTLAALNTKVPSQGQAAMAASVPVVIASNQSAVPVSGTVAVDTSLLATKAIQTDKTQFTKLTDGTDTALVTAAGEQNVIATAQPGIDIGDVTINNAAGAAAVNIQDGGNTITVDGTVALAAGAAVIGHVINDAGSAIIGKVGIDQTTPGTTNLVALTAETTKVIGTINIAAAQTLATVTTVGAVTSITNNVNTVEVAPTTVLNGKTTVTTAGTRVVLAASTACKSVTIKALTSNTGLIYVGSSTVAASNGYQLSAGDSISLDIANLNTVNIDSSINLEGVTYLGIN